MLFHKRTCKIAGHCGNQMLITNPDGEDGGKEEQWMGGERQETRVPPPQPFDATVNHLSKIKPVFLF